MMNKRYFPLAALFLTAFSLLLTSGIVAENTPAPEPSLAEKLIKMILERGYKKVAILPRIVSRVTGNQNDVTGKNTLGALSMAWPDELYDALVEAAQASGGKFAVVSDQQVMHAVQDKSLDDVGSDEMWRVIREKTGADYLASIDVTDPGPKEGKTGAAEIKRVLNGVDLNNNTPSKRIAEIYNKSLSDAAYAGESFVVREWKGNQLNATGLRGGNLFGTGQGMEKEQYANLTPQQHPLLRTDYPYGIYLEVKGQKREAKEVDGQLVVPLDIGEEYLVRVWNRGEKDVFMALYIDGVNTIGAQLEKPETTPTNRTWYLKPDKDTRKVAGWQKVDPKTREATFEKFVIVNSTDAVAKEKGQPGGSGFTDNLGMITAVFYTYGMDNIPQSKGVSRFPPSNIGTGKGKKESGGVAGFDENQKQKGLILSTMTIYYRNPKWFQDYSDAQKKKELVEGPKPESKVKPEKKKDPAPEKKTETKKEPPKPKDKDSENDLPK